MQANDGQHKLYVCEFRSLTIQRLSLGRCPNEETDTNLARLSSSRYDDFQMKWTLTPPFAGQSSKLESVASSFPFLSMRGSSSIALLH